MSPRPLPLPLRGALLVLALALLAALVWLAGPRFGLAAPAARLGWILLLLLPGLAWVLVLARLRAGRQSAPPAPPLPAEVAALRQGMARALAALRGPRPGRRQRLALPWYLVLGPTGAGKTSLLERSGLRFSLAPEPPPGPAATGCRWHFATEGVLLEAPGRFADADADGEPGDWPELARLLRARRRRRPLAGVILALPLDDLAGPGAADHGRRLRRRLGDLRRRFGRTVPAYLVVTGLDRLRGFAAFCAALPEEAAGPAWGAILEEVPRPSRGAVPGPGGDLPAWTAAHFDELYRGLDQAVTDPLGRQPGANPELAAFPLEFRALRPGLLAFAGALVEADPFHPPACLRGFWFTSARPGPAPAWAAGDRIVDRFALGRPAEPESAPPPDPPRFLSGLFQEAILADRHGAWRRGPTRRPWTRGAAVAAGLALLVLLAWAWATSLAGNRALLAATRADLREARALAAGPSPEDRLRGLRVLQRRLEHLAEPRPLALAWGLYQGGRAERRVRAQYGADLAQVLLEPVRARLEATLAAPARASRVPGPDPVHAALATYLMLGRREARDRARLAEQLPHWWGPWLRQQSGGSPSPQLTRLADATVAFFLDQLGRPDQPVIGLRPDLVAAARARLGPRRRPALERRYDALKAEAAGRFEPLTLARILQREDPDLRAGAGPVPGCFTRAAWEGYFREALETAARTPASGAPEADGVLEQPPEDLAPGAALAGLEALYKADYAQAWLRFLGGLGLAPWSGPEAAAPALGRLGDPRLSALRLVLARAAQETGWDNPSPLDRSLRAARSRVLAGTGRLLGTDLDPEPGGTSGPGWLGTRFARVATWAPAEGAGTLDGFLERLGKIRDRLQAVAAGGDPDGAAHQWLQATHQGQGELAEARQWLDRELAGALGDPAAGEALGTLLAQPLARAYGALLAGAERDLERAWTQEVYGPWLALAGRYPIGAAEPDILPAELAQFLLPGTGTLARFVDSRLAGLVTFQEGGWTARSWAGQGPGLSRTFLAAVGRLGAAGAGLGDGGPARFELRPEPSPGLAEIDLEIDGQRLRYRNGPQAWTAFTWPGPGPEPGARIGAVALDGASAGDRAAPGPMGLARLLAQARIEPSPTTAVLTWRLVPPAPTRGGGPTVRFALRRLGGTDPLRLATLRGLALPARICR